MLQKSQNHKIHNFVFTKNNFKFVRDFLPKPKNCMITGVVYSYSYSYTVYCTVHSYIV